MPDACNACLLMPKSGANGHHQQPITPCFSAWHFRQHHKTIVPFSSPQTWDGLLRHHVPPIACKAGWSPGETVCPWPLSPYPYSHLLQISGGGLSPSTAPAPTPPPGPESWGALNLHCGIPLSGGSPSCKEGNSAHLWILSHGNKDPNGGRPCIHKILKLQQSHPSSGGPNVSPRHPPSRRFHWGLS